MAKVSSIRHLDASQLYRRYIGLELLRCDSSNVYGYAYDETIHVMFVAFLDKSKSGKGSAYAYDCNLLPEIHAAPSKGKFVHYVLRAQGIDYLQID